MPDRGCEHFESQIQKAGKNLYSCWTHFSLLIGDGHEARDPLAVRGNRRRTGTLNRTQLQFYAVLCLLAASFAGCEKRQAARLSDVSVQASSGPVPLRICTIGFKSPTGASHSVDVETESSQRGVRSYSKLEFSHGLAIREGAEWET